jgi:CubicO group peptidase (beta-lactamase class C family)
MLEEKGKLSLQDPMSKYFPAFPAWAKSITIQHLLTHTSGIADYEALMPDTTTVPIMDAGVVELLQRCDSVYFKPGEKAVYSNSAYVLLGVIVEKVSGQRFPDFVATHIYKPLNMNASSMNSPQASISNRAYGYSIRKDSTRRTDQSTTSYTLGDGAVYSSLNDLFQWDQALYTSRLVKPATLKRIYTAQPGTAGMMGSSGYGYGWFIHEKGDSNWVSHSGGTSGFSTWIERHPAQQFSIIILMNRSGQNMDKWGEKIRTFYGF